MSRFKKLSGASLAKSATRIGGNQFDKIIDKMGIQLLKGLETVSAEKQRAFKTGNVAETNVKGIIKKCAGENVKINAASNLIPGPSCDGFDGADTNKNTQKSDGNDF